MFPSRLCTIGFYILLNLCASNVLCQGQGQRMQHIAMSNGNIAYPENGEQDPDLQNAKDKSPVYLAQSCKEGEILYPGDQVDDWVCDCRPAYIYSPQVQQCYHVYTRGPCAPGSYLVLPKNHVVPVCVPNPCVDDNFVWFREACYKLDTEGPCTWGAQISNVVGVNETTLEIICTKDYKIEIWSRMSDDEGNRTTMESGGNGYAPTSAPPPIIPDEPSLIINGTMYAEQKCFQGGRRWITAKQMFFQTFGNYLDNCIIKNQFTQETNSNTQLQVEQNIQDIFSTNPGSN